MSAWYENKLQTQLADLDLLASALDESQHDLARAIVGSMRENVRAEIAYQERRTTEATGRQCWYLASLTGAGYPKAYWESLGLTPKEASDAITDLKGFGEAMIRGIRYYRITTDRQEKNKALKRKLNTGRQSTPRTRSKV